MSAAKNISILQ